MVGQMLLCRDRRFLVNFAFHMIIYDVSGDCIIIAPSQQQPGHSYIPDAKEGSKKPFVRGQQTHGVSDQIALMIISCQHVRSRLILGP